jgi:DNA-binding response OmpR family regulator
MMPNMDGWELCREIKVSFDMPVLMLTAEGETSQKLKGFQLGTDDYLVKPFEPLELVARVKALLKRYKIEFSQTIQVGKVMGFVIAGSLLVMVVIWMAFQPGLKTLSEQMIESPAAS